MSEKTILGYPSEDNNTNLDEQGNGGALMLGSEAKKILKKIRKLHKLNKKSSKG